MNIEPFIPYLGAGAIAYLTYILGIKKQKQESKKLELEAESLSLDTEFRLIKFYEDQVIALTNRYETLCQKLENKIQQYENCVQKVEQLERKCNDAITQLNKFKNEG